MEPKEILAQLVLLSSRAGIGVRFDALGRNLAESRGGLCWLRGRPVVILDATAPILDQIGVLASSLRTCSSVTVRARTGARQGNTRRAPRKRARK